MSKRNNVQYIKPAEPKFLQALKAQIGFKSEPTIDAKRQRFEEDSDSDRSDIDEEAPQVVVLKKGDLTAEQVEEEKKRIEIDEKEKPADLSQRIVFKSKKSEKQPTSTSESSSNQTEKKRPSRPQVSQSKLSFQVEDEEDDDDDEE